MNLDSKKNDNSESFGCPTEAALEAISGKWKGVILYHLSSGTKRFSELQRLAPGITQRMLTMQLRSLEADEIVHREVYPQVPPQSGVFTHRIWKNIRTRINRFENLGR